VTIVDRKKDMIIRGGENIHPAEIEARVSQHPDIVECAAFALPDPLLGECVALAYRTQIGEPINPEVLHNELLAQLAAYKRPTLIVALTSPLPRSPSGKVLKGELPALVQSLPG
ncbi:MAG: AMP-binding enzyme, partial [Spongiibacter sp.]